GRSPQSLHRPWNPRRTPMRRRIQEIARILERHPYIAITGRIQAENQRISRPVFCHPKRGSIYRYDTYTAELKRAFAAAGLEWPERMRPCHDLRVTAITNDAIAGAHPIAIMTKAGHASMATTKRYLKLAGVVFRDEAQALEERRLGSSLSTGSHTDLRERQATSAEAGSLDEAESALSDVP